MDLERRSVDLTRVTEWAEGRVRRVQDALAGEEPLEIRVGDTPLAVTMRTPGDDLELAAGFLFTEGIIQRREQILSLEMAKPEAGTRPGTQPGPQHGKQLHTQAGNLVVAQLEGDVQLDAEKTQRNFFANSSCGICGKASIDAVRSRFLRAPNAGFRVRSGVLCGLPEKLGASQDIFSRTGGLHAAGLFTASGELVVAREDIGRHNAVDKVVGWALREWRLPLAEFVLVVSGRCGFEIAQKAIAAGIPIVASVSAPSSLAVQLARELNLTLVGFLRGKRFVVYSGEERIILGSE
ncbi:MAG: formate dehydrogenase accessory sulfurtransferase FdhD [Candidatus Acidiferrales bacterium]